MGHIPVILKTDNVDVVILNQLKSNIILKNNIIQEGVLIYESPGVKRIDIEPAIIGEYRDFRIMESQYYKD